MSVLTDITPEDLDFPAKFQTFRKIQVEAAEYALYGIPGAPPRRFTAMALATGCGKSALSQLIGRMNGTRFGVLTATRALEDQYVGDKFPWLVNIRGKNNYECWDDELKPNGTDWGRHRRFTSGEEVGDKVLNCEEGYSQGCSHCGKSRECTYTQQYDLACRNDFVSNYQYWMHVRAWSQAALEDGENAKRPVGMLVCDECFPSYTKVDGKPISEIKERDFVTAYDERTGTFANRRVRAVMQRKVSKILCLTFSDGSTVTCTENHPFYTAVGWLKAGELGSNLVLRLKNEASYHKTKTSLWDAADPNRMCLVQGSTDNLQAVGQEPLPREGFRNLRSLLRISTHKKRDRRYRHTMHLLQGSNARNRAGTKGQVSTTRISILRQRVCTEISPSSPQCLYSRDMCSQQCQNESEQPYGQSNYQGQGQDRLKGHGMETDCTRWEWQRSDRASNVIGLGTRLADGVSNTDRRALRARAKSLRLPNLLQGRHSQPRTQDRHRGRRYFTPREETSGSETGRQVSWVRVVDVEICESSDTQRFEELCPGGVVYNIEVEDLHTYTADGFVVHNCHKIDGQLTKFLSVWIAKADLTHFAQLAYQSTMIASQGQESGRVDSRWVGMCGEAHDNMVGTMARIKSQIRENVTETNPVASEERIDHLVNKEVRRHKEYNRLDKLTTDLGRVIAFGNDNNWLWRMTRNGIEFQAIWPGRYAERYLWSGVEKIVLISATLRPKALEILGLKPNDYRFKEWPRIFPAANNPVVWVPTGRMGRKADDTERMKSVDRFDEVFEEYGWEKKGIVQVPSYKLAEWLRQHSRFGKFMHINKSGEAVQTAEEFRKAKAPAVLVSPSFTEGWDFADDACEWIVVLKLPYPDQSDPVIVARSDSDREFYDYVTMQTLVQECGRGCRHEADKCIVIITDDAVGKFRKYAAKHAPSWFGIKEVDSIPKVDTLK